MIVLLGLSYYQVGRSREFIKAGTEFENKYEESEQYYRKIFDVLQDAVIVYDFSAGEVIDINESCSHMFGYSKIEIKESRLFGDEEKPFFQFIKQAMGEGRLAFEIPIQKRSKSRFWGEVTLRISKLNSRKCIIVVVRDISVRKA